MNGNPYGAEAIKLGKPLHVTTLEEAAAIDAREAARKPPPRIKGATLMPNGRVKMRITGGGYTQKLLGYFDTPMEAVLAYNARAKDLGVELQKLPDQATLDAFFASAPASKAAKAAAAPKQVKQPMAAASSSVAKAAAVAAAESAPTKVSAASEKMELNPTVHAEHAGLDPEELLRVVMDMRKPGQWYPLARSMKRDIHVHVGPTNSGGGDRPTRSTPHPCLFDNRAPGTHNRGGPTHPTSVIV